MGGVWGYDPGVTRVQVLVGPRRDRVGPIGPTVPYDSANQFSTVITKLANYGTQNEKSVDPPNPLSPPGAPGNWFQELPCRLLYAFGALYPTMPINSRSEQKTKMTPNGDRALTGAVFNFLLRRGRF